MMDDDNGVNEKCDLKFYFYVSAKDNRLAAQDSCILCVCIGKRTKTRRTSLQYNNNNHINKVQNGFLSYFSTQRRALRMRMRVILRLQYTLHTT